MIPYVISALFTIACILAYFTGQRGGMHHGYHHGFRDGFRHGIETSDQIADRLKALRERLEKLQ